MTPSALVRAATPADLEALAHLREALWPESTAAEHANELADILAGRPFGILPLLVFVAETPGQPQTLVGFLEASLSSVADGCDPSQPVGYVEGWYVADSHRRQGVGAALLRAAEAWARSQGCREMSLRHPNHQHPLPAGPRIPRLPSRRTRHPLPQVSLTSLAGVARLT